MGRLRDRMAEDLRLGGFSASTQRIYLHYAKRFTAHFHRSPLLLGESEVRAYLLYLLDDRKLSHDSYWQCYAALKFLYAVTLSRPFEVEAIPRHRNKPGLPVVLSGSEVQRLLGAFDSIKYRTITMALYAAGLRVSEACQLCVRDIDSARRLIHVRKGKGGKDRYVMLSTRLLVALRVYWKEYRPADLLFPARSAKGYLRPASVRKAMRCAAERARLNKRVTPHMLRHSFATHLLETGVDLRVVQVLLGHLHLCMTMRYTKVSTRHIQRIQSPFDLLDTPEGTVLG